MLKEFKTFIMRGNVLDLAVGIIIGGAFGKIISSFVNDILMPPLGMIMGKINFADLFINLSGKPKDIVVTRLSVQIRRRADGQTLWEGRAETSAKVGTPASQAGLSASKLANALFRDYPGKSGETITVK